MIAEPVGTNIRIPAVVFLLLAGTAEAALGQAGRLSGKVTDESSGAVLEGARIVVTGTSIIETTDQEGRYTVRSIQPGHYQVRALRIGYQPTIDSVTIAPEETAALDFALKQAPVQLDEIVTTATGEQRKLEVGNAVSTIDAAGVTETQPVKELGDILSGRAPGVQVLKSGGTVGTGTRIRIRGSNSISLSNEPLYYIDGIRMESGSNSLTIDLAGQSVSRINDINPDEIEDIEIVKGPAAATLYGIQAANGVVRITTKRGRSGKPKWNVWSEMGANTDPHTYPLNYFGRDTTAATGADFDGFCTIQANLDGLCTQTSVDKYSPLQDPKQRPFKAGLRQEYGANVSGGNDLMTYFLSAQYTSEDGPYRLPKVYEDSINALRGSTPQNQIRPNAVQSTSLRANLTANVSRNADLVATLGYVSSDTRLVENDNSFLTVVGSGESSNYLPDFNNGWYFTPAELFAELVTQGVERFTGGLTANWRPTGWLSTRATVGYDVTNRTDVQFFPTGQVADYLENRRGLKQNNRAQISQTSVDLAATGRFNLSSAWTSKTSIGGQFYRDMTTTNFALGRILPAGSGTIAGAGVTEASDQTIESRSVGSYVEQEFGLKQRLFLTGALRFDDNSAFGDNFNAVTYPKASVSYLLSEEPFFHAAWLKTLRLRGAFGASGQQPGTNDARQFFVSVGSKKNGVPDVGVELGNLGNPDLKPERSREIELGLDASMFESRLGVELTFYHKQTRDALILRGVDPSAGTTGSQFFNLGKLRNYGFELAIDTRIIDKPSLTWDLQVSGSTTSNKVLDLGKGVEPILVGFYQRHVKGYPAGGLWSPTVHYKDANKDGIIDIGEVSLGADKFQGSAIPTKEASLNTTLGLFKGRVRIGSQFDYRGGFKVDNSIEQFRCFSVGNCRGLYDKKAPLREQAFAQALSLPGAGNALGFFEDGWFIKLRELSLTFAAPNQWARMVGANTLSLTLAGRNLWTITDYSGVDPEVNSFGQSNFFTSDFEAQPPTRLWVARVNASF
jgi:TonB-linked SusC/RagA family outer membrane protein